MKNVDKQLDATIRVGGPERAPDLRPTTTQGIIPHAVNHSLAILRMGKKLPETCSTDWNINKTVIIASSWSSTLFIYIDDARSNAHQIYRRMLCFRELFLTQLAWLYT
jgi:hypothetical protein